MMPADLAYFLYLVVRISAMMIIHFDAYRQTVYGQLCVNMESRGLQVDRFHLQPFLCSSRCRDGKED